MRGDTQVRLARLPARLGRRPARRLRLHRPLWLAQALERRRHARAQRLEWIERLSREERRARQSGSHVPESRREMSWR